LREDSTWGEDGLKLKKLDRLEMFENSLQTSKQQFDIINTFDFSII